MRRRHGSFPPFCLLALLLVATPLAADDCAPPDSLQITHVGLDSINLVPSGDVDSVALGLGAGMWNGCSGSGSVLPSFSVNGSGDIDINVVFHSGSCPSAGCGCGTFQPQRNGGELTGGTVNIYDSTNSGNDCTSTLHQTVGHELGHVLGLNDATGSGCSTRIMGPRQSGVNRTVTTGDCASADDRWVTMEEFHQDPPDDDPRGDGPCAI